MSRGGGLAREAWNQRFAAALVEGGTEEDAALEIARSTDGDELYTTRPHDPERSAEQYLEDYV